MLSPQIIQNLGIQRLCTQSHAVHTEFKHICEVAFDVRERIALDCKLLNLKASPNLFDQRPVPLGRKKTRGSTPEIERDYPDVLGNMLEQLIELNRQSCKK
jgi:hypothetical protein